MNIKSRFFKGRRKNQEIIDKNDNELNQLDALVWGDTDSFLSGKANYYYKVWVWIKESDDELLASELDFET